jgi:Ulp1 protease family, C-terminal catalytic domain
VRDGFGDAVERRLESASGRDRGEDGERSHELGGRDGGASEGRGQFESEGVRFGGAGSESDRTGARVATSDGVGDRGAAAGVAAAAARDAPGEEAEGIGDDDVVMLVDSSAAGSADGRTGASRIRLVTPIKDILFFSSRTTMDATRYDLVRRAREENVAHIAEFGWLNGRSLATLLGRGHLNDEVVNALAYVVTRRTDAAPVSSYFLDALIGLPDAEDVVINVPEAIRCTRHLPSRPTYLVPIHSPGNGSAPGHWALLSINRVEKTFVYYDSTHPGHLPRRARDAVGALPHWLRAFEYSDSVRAYTTTNARSMPSQPNTWDCGVFVVAAMACLARGLSPDDAFSSDAGPRMRQSFLLRLLSSPRPTQSS